MGSDNMRIDYFKNCEELSDYMVDKAQDGIYTVAVLFYPEAMELVKYLMRYDDIETMALDIKPVEYNGYNKEYYVSLADDMVVSVEPAYNEGRYLDACADLTLIDSNASSSIIINIPKNKYREISIGSCEDTVYCYDEDSLDEYTIKPCLQKDVEVFNELLETFFNTRFKI